MELGCWVCVKPGENSGAAHTLGLTRCPRFWHIADTLLGDPTRQTRLAKATDDSLHRTRCIGLLAAADGQKRGRAGKCLPPRAAPSWRSVVGFLAASFHIHVLQILLAP